MTENTKKLILAASATVVAASLMLGGTLAWQSISQEAVNVISNEVNPGGRLHDDFDGTANKDVYVENFGTQPIFARIMLKEHLEKGENAGSELDREYVKVLTVNEDGLPTTLGQTDTYATYYYQGSNISDAYWTKTWGGLAAFMPTFNMNQDSLQPDLNGTYDYIDPTTGEHTPYGDHAPVENSGIVKTDTETRDADANDLDEGDRAIEFDGTNASYANVKKQTAVHTSAFTNTSQVISMETWLAMSNDDKIGNFWVYDTDGWAYWASPIYPDGEDGNGISESDNNVSSATGLLLNGITDLQVMDDDYYYAIHVIAQFVTADDFGYEDSTGFYKDGYSVTGNALALLHTIGAAQNITDPALMLGTSDGYVVYNSATALYVRNFTSTDNIAVSIFDQNGADISNTFTKANGASTYALSGDPTPVCIGYINITDMNVTKITITATAIVSDESGATTQTANMTINTGSKEIVITPVPTQEVIPTPTPVVEVTPTPTIEPTPEVTPTPAPTLEPTPTTAPDTQELAVAIEDGNSYSGNYTPGSEYRITLTGSNAGAYTIDGASISGQTDSLTSLKYAIGAQEKNLILSIGENETGTITVKLPASAEGSDNYYTVTLTPNI